jgi:hypothetical protein
MIENLQYSNGTDGVILAEFLACCSEPTGASFNPRPGDVGAMRLSIREVVQ